MNRMQNDLLQYIFLLHYSQIIKPFSSLFEVYHNLFHRCHMIKNHISSFANKQPASLSITHLFLLIYFLLLLPVYPRRHSRLPIVRSAPVLYRVYFNYFLRSWGRNYPSVPPTRVLCYIVTLFIFNNFCFL